MIQLSLFLYADDNPMNIFTCLLLGTSIFLPFIFSGSFGGFALIAGVTLGVAALLFLTITKKRIIKNKPNILLSKYFFISLLFLPFSHLWIHSVPVLIWWLVYLVTFLYSQCLVKDQYVLVIISKVFVIMTVVFAISSIYQFISTGLTSYTRLDGFIGQHNIYGGFLILPFLISLYLIFKERRDWKSIIWLFSNAVIFSSVILTFSRGTWLSIVLALAFSLVLFKKAIRLRLEILKPALFLTLLTALMASGIWFSAKQSASYQAMIKDSGVNSTVFSQQNIEENALTARFHYFSDAWHTFTYSPITGFGSGMYSNAVRMYKTDPNFDSFADPHNWLLKMLVENGLIVTIIFLVFIVILFWQLSRMIIRREDFPWLAATIFTGLVGSTIHGLMDFDWSNNLLLFNFFLFAGLLYGYLLNTEKSDMSNRYDIAGQKTPTYFPLWFNYILLILLLISLVTSVQLFRADFYRTKGDIYLFKVGDTETAKISYFESLVINKYEPTTFYDLWRVYFLTKRYDVALDMINKAIAISPQNSLYYAALAQTEVAIGDLSHYHETLLKAVKYFPSSDLTSQTELADFDYKQGNYGEALSVINSVVPIYTKYQSALWYRNDPNSETIDANLTKLKELEKKIKEELGKINEKSKIN